MPIFFARRVNIGKKKVLPFYLPRRSTENQLAPEFLKQSEETYFNANFLAKLRPLAGFCFHC